MGIGSWEFWKVGRVPLDPAFLFEAEMDIDAWLDAAIADAKRRGLPELEPLLRALAKSTEALRAADFAEQPDAIVDELAAHANTRHTDN